MRNKSSLLRREAAEDWEFYLDACPGPTGFVSDVLTDLTDARDGAVWTSPEAAPQPFYQLGRAVVIGKQLRRSSKGYLCFPGPSS